MMLLAAGVVTPVRAGTAFFTKDGAEVVFLPVNKPGFLWKLQVGSGKLDSMVLSGPLKGKKVTSLTQGAEGEILIAAENALWVLDPSGVPRKIADEPAPQEFFPAPATEGPLKDWLFTVRPADGYPGDIFYARKPGAKSFRPVFCRRTERVGAGTFTSDGRFFFSAQGDLWEGGFDASEDEGTGNIATLVGCRIAPVAMLNTDMTNSGNQTVREIHIVADTIFIGLGGRHQGSILQMPLPGKTAYPPDSESGPPDLPTSLEIQRQSFAKLEIAVPEIDGLTAMAATSIEGQPAVFYRGEGVGLWLWTSLQAPRLVASEPR